MEDLIAWEADPLAFKVTALAGDDDYGMKDTDDGGDDDGSYQVKYGDDGDYRWNCLKLDGSLWDTFVSVTF